MVNDQQVSLTGRNINYFLIVSVVTVVFTVESVTTETVSIFGASVGVTTVIVSVVVVVVSSFFLSL